jgi:hypothetical protein
MTLLTPSYSAKSYDTLVTGLLNDLEEGRIGIDGAQ